MKLDKIKFAQLISYITNITGYTLDNDQVAAIDATIDVVIEQPSTNINPEQLHVLMALMHEGNSKIEAIKQHRMMTGYGLKESKDIVEKYWPNKQYDHKKLNDEVTNSKYFDAHQKAIICQFIDRLT